MVSLTAIIPIGFTDGNLFSLRETLLACSQHGIKVVLIHDDHDDGTKDLIDVLFSECPWLQIERGKFRAPGLARNLGISRVDTEWFCFWDVDDKPNVENIAEAISNLNSSSVEIIVGLFSTEDSKTNIRRLWKYPKSSKNIPIEIAINPGLWRFIFRTNEYKNCMFEGGTMGEDQLFLAQAQISFENMRTVNEEFYVYVTNRENQLTAIGSRAVQLHTVISREAEVEKNCNGKVFADLLIVKQSLTLIRMGIFNRKDTFWIFVKTIGHLKFQALQLMALTILNARRGL